VGISLFPLPPHRRGFTARLGAVMERKQSTENLQFNKAFAEMERELTEIQQTPYKGYSRAFASRHSKNYT